MTRPDYVQDGAVGDGVATIADNQAVLDTWFPDPRIAKVTRSRSRRLSAAEATAVFGLRHPLGRDTVRRVESVAIRVQIRSLADPPVDAPDVYLRLHLLSARLARPRQINLDEVFGLLTTVVWTSAGPCTVNEFERIRTGLRTRGTLTVDAVSAPTPALASRSAMTA